MNKKQIAITVVVILLVILVTVAGMRWYANREVYQVVGNKNMQAFLLAIRNAEGTDNPDGYRTMFTGKKFDSFADHPRQTNCVGSLCSTAAGAYQFLSSIWDYLRIRLSLPDFNPANQDKAAIELIREKGALNDILAGNISQATTKLNKTWTSLPGGSQQTRTLAQVQNYYTTQGGGLA